ncbi:ATP-binding protein [Paenibacillus sp. TRM 82003]|nr:ATP-binding protein [Paenibacillus sp. TRM 82003]
MLSLQTLLLNLLFLILFLFFVPLLLEMYPKRLAAPRRKRTLLASSYALAVACCISFPFTITEGYIYDLRLIALTIGGLYGGIGMSLFLSAVTIAYRWIAVGGIGAWGTTIVVFCTLLPLLLLSPSFATRSRKAKLLLGSAVSMFGALLSLVVSEWLFGIRFTSEFAAMFSALTLGSTLFLVFAYETASGAIATSQRVVQAEKLETVSHLASSISHEVRNPLTVVRGFLQMLEDSELDAEKRRAYIRISIGEIDRANDIIANYLTFAKPAEERFVPLQMEREMEDLLQIVTPLANLNSVQVVATLQPGIVLGDAPLLRQCLLNLAKNCIEAMPGDQGVLRVETILETNEAQKHYVIRLSDNGKGMTKEQLARLGEPYFTTKGREGTGLGMMAAMHVVNLMNGRMQVTSRENEGTTFTIQLPHVR